MATSGPMFRSQLKVKIRLLKSRVALGKRRAEGTPPRETTRAAGVCSLSGARHAEALTP